MPASSRSTTPPSRAEAATGSAAATNSLRTGTWIVALLVLLLLILHQDNWFWTDGRLVFGIFPVGLVWHVGISLAASLTWLLATQIAWPMEPELEAKIIDAAADAHDQEPAN